MGIDQIILERRKKLGLTQQELAHKLGVTDRSVSRWEKGSSTPDIHSLKRLSELLNIPMDKFYSEITVEPIVEERLDTLIINRFITLSIISSGLLFVSIILILVSFYMTHRSNESFIFQVIGIISVIISITIFVISNITFTASYRAKKLQSDYKRLKLKHLIIFCSILVFCIILLIIIINL